MYTLLNGLLYLHYKFGDIYHCLTMFDTLSVHVTGANGRRGTPDGLSADGQQRAQQQARPAQRHGGEDAQPSLPQHHPPQQQR